MNAAMTRQPDSKYCSSCGRPVISEDSGAVLEAIDALPASAYPVLVVAPIALASIFSKYLRELLMARFNAYWAGHVDDLRPTAGYYQDGQRFLRDIEPAIGRLGVDRSQLVRVQ